MAAPVAKFPTTIPFEPKPRLKIPWETVINTVSIVAGLYLAFVGIETLAAGRRAFLGIPLRATHGIDLLAIGFLVGVAAPAYILYMNRRAKLEMDSRLPDFLTDLASLHKAGLTLQESLMATAQGSYGSLTKEVRFAADQVRWNIPILTALDNLRVRIGTPMAHRMFTVLLEAGHTGGNVPEVLEITAHNARQFVKLRDGRSRGMGIYTIITYVASLVFIGVCLALHGIFVPKMIAAFAGTSGSGLGLARLPDADRFRTLFYVSALVQAIGNGIVGGVMGEGHALSGLRHAWTMVLLCFLGFLIAQ